MGFALSGIDRCEAKRPYNGTAAGSRNEQLEYSKYSLFGGGRSVNFGQKKEPLSGLNFNFCTEQPRANW
jgi:hypothetical protein